MIALLPSPLEQLPSEWDCLVIGAGPGGSLAAHQLARQGWSTLLVERKSFPRKKVCGGCLNQRAVSLLDAAGLGSLLQECGAVPLSHFLVRAGGRELRLPLPGGFAVSRSTFDSALAAAATEIGASFLQETSATVQPRSARDSHWTVRLRAEHSGDNPIEVRARTVIAADGLGHPSLKLLPELTEQISPHSRIGVGALIACELQLEPGIIHMAVGRVGYVGMVQVEQGLLNIGAALEPESLKHHSIRTAVNLLLEECGFPELSTEDADWTGTPRLTRSTDPVALNGLFLIGDATGYVEPFTGEGMAWALAGGSAVAECVELAMNSSQESAADHWQALWEQRVARRQKWCRRLARVLRSPTAVNLAMRAACGFPSLAAPIVNHLNRTSSPSPSTQAIHEF